MSIFVDQRVNPRCDEAVPAKARSRFKLADDKRRPTARMRYLPARSLPPRQPARPVVGAYRSVANAGVVSGSTQQLIAAGGRWKLTDRALLLIMIGFVLAVFLGSWVVVTQYLALAPNPV